MTLRDTHGQVNIVMISSMRFVPSVEHSPRKLCMHASEYCGLGTVAVATCDVPVAGEDPKLVTFRQSYEQVRLLDALHVLKN